MKSWKITTFFVFMAIALAGIAAGTTFSRPSGTTRFQTQSAAKLPLPSAWLDEEFNNPIALMNSSVMHLDGSKAMSGGLKMGSQTVGTAASPASDIITAGPWIDVRSGGVVLNDSSTAVAAANSVALQTLLDAGGDIRWGGSLYFSGQLKVRKGFNVSLGGYASQGGRWGSDQSSLAELIWTGAAGTDAIVVGGETGHGNTVGGFHRVEAVRLHNFYLHPNVAYQMGNAIVLDASSTIDANRGFTRNIKIENVTVKYADGYGLLAQGAVYDVRVYDSTFAYNHKSAYESAVAAVNEGPGYPSQVWFYSCLMYGMTHLDADVDSDAWAIGGAGGGWTMMGGYVHGDYGAEMAYATAMYGTHVEGLVASASVRTAAFKWTASGSGTDEYYLELAAGGDPNLPSPGAMSQDSGSTAMAAGSVGSLAVTEYWFGDNDVLGYDTIYVRLTDGADPDSKAADFVMYTGSRATGPAIQIIAKGVSVYPTLIRNWETCAQVGTASAGDIQGFRGNIPLMSLCDQGIDVVANGSYQRVGHLDVGEYSSVTTQTRDNLGAGHFKTKALRYYTGGDTAAENVFLARDGQRIGWGHDQPYHMFEYDKDAGSGEWYYKSHDNATTEQTRLTVASKLQYENWIWSNTITHTKPFQAMAAGDADPPVYGGKNYTLTQGGAFTITNFVGGVDGQEIFIAFLDGNSTFDFTGSLLKGYDGAGDYTAGQHDTMHCTYYAPGTTWYCDINEN